MRGVGVANIVEANLRAIELADQRLKMDVQRLETLIHYILKSPFLRSST